LLLLHVLRSHVGRAAPLHSSTCTTAPSDVIGGYEDIKLGDVDEFRLGAPALLEHLKTLPAPTASTLQLRLHYSTTGN
jgi:hypothetical protein